MHKEQALETTTHLSLGIGLQPEQTAHLQGFSLDDSSPHEVLRVGVHIVQESRAKEFLSSLRRPKRQLEIRGARRTRVLER